MSDPRWTWIKKLIRPSAQSSSLWTDSGTGCRLVGLCREISGRRPLAVRQPPKLTSWSGWMLVAFTMAARFLISELTNAFGSSGALVSGSMSPWPASPRPPVSQSATSVSRSVATTGRSIFAFEVERRPPWAAVPSHCLWITARSVSARLRQDEPCRSVHERLAQALPASNQRALPLPRRADAGSQGSVLPWRSPAADGR
jgi:hypothetical protein